MPIEYQGNEIVSFRFVGEISLIKRMEEYALEKGVKYRTFEQDSKKVLILQNQHDYNIILNEFYSDIMK